jgi:hypothetical protein
MPSLEHLIRSASRALVIGVGGGGDVVGALATARFLEFCGIEFVVGGLSVFRTVSRPAQAVQDSASLDDANEALHALGLRTELDLERDGYRARTRPGQARESLRLGLQQAEQRPPGQ